MAGLRVLAAGAAVVWFAASTPALLATPAEQVVWRLDNLQRIGGRPTAVIGAPRVVNTSDGKAIEFDGANDGLLIDANPLQGLTQFTLEVLFQPSSGGAEEQRFVHIEETGSANRALIELRRLPEGTWALDTFLRHGPASLTLLDRSLAHPADQWHVATMTFDGKVMQHYVDGVREAGGEVAFKPLGPGRTSIGVRQNRVNWFKGRIRTIRVSAAVLPPRAFLQVPPGSGSRRVIPLWPEGVPGAQASGGDEYEKDERVYNVQNPTLTYVPPQGSPSGTAVIVCPGGGYTRLAIANEGEGAARELAARGVATFILKYRLKEYGFPAPLQDVLRAVRLLRARAMEFGINPNRIGVFGASAGGHVAAMSATMFDAPEGKTGTSLDTTSARPDFIALLYPVITMKEPFVNRGSRDNLLGSRPSAALVERLSLELQVRSDAPPAFLVHTTEDTSVPIENSIMFFNALRQARVPAELHVYEKGAHGFGFSTGLGPASGWPDRLEDWMRSHGWLDAAIKRP